ncbi:putative aquaporin NIP7-1 [Tripterygium wilfordii]|uniref:Putative aquaporin NIP7-1 n=1 Tax=Tripterygium wilfordii TaxID=458696 RepID=A0A7J7E0W9_TRIWF|nr:putative aquaporin NIP7-1 [Tripterygium wilfordii]
MKEFLEQQPQSSEITNIATSSGTSGDDQDSRSNTTSPRTNRETFLDNPGFCCFQHGKDLNPARMVMAELVGTFILMICICGILASTQLTRGEVGLLEYAATAGLTVVVVVFCIGQISGAHINPAVTLALAIFCNFPWSMVIPYIVAQIIGSVLATFIGKSVYGISTELMATRPLHGCGSAFWVELISTFIVMFLAASVTYEIKSVGHLSGIVVGMAIGLAILITGPVSGGSMNPARSLGPAIVSLNFNDIWIYIVGPTLGAVAGALLYRLLRLQRQPCSTRQSPNTSLLPPSTTCRR